MTDFNGPRMPETHEWDRIIEFLNTHLRAEQTWPIASEYPTALNTQNIHNISIITDSEKIISHAVLKVLIIKTPHIIFKVGAIGSVLTDPNYRNQGLSRKNLEKCLDLAKQQECDFVILWTDQFDFYRKLGFELAGIDHSYIVEKPSVIKNKNLRFVSGNNVDPQALLKLYSTHTVQSVRTLEDFRSFLKIPQCNLFTAWNEHNQLVAYAAEGKGADLTNYIHEWGGQVDALLDLFSYIYSQKNTPITIMIPEHSINLRKQMPEISDFAHQGFLGMIKLTNPDGVMQKVKKAFRAEGHEKIVLEKQNNQIVFGFGMDLYTLDKESDLVGLLFGPLQVSSLSFMSEDCKQKFSSLLPLPMWIWGWDSI